MLIGGICELPRHLSVLGSYPPLNVKLAWIRLIDVLHLSQSWPARKRVRNPQVTLTRTLTGIRYGVSALPIDRLRKGQKRLLIQLVHIQSSGVHQQRPLIRSVVRIQGRWAQVRDCFR